MVHRSPAPARLVIALVAALGLLAQPALALRSPTPDAPPPGEWSAPSMVDALDALLVNAQRAVVIDGLVAAGEDLASACRQVVQLTPDDLAVLAGHPAMMQRAGSLGQLEIALIIGGIIIVGLVILASNSSGFLFVGG